MRPRVEIITKTFGNENTRPGVCIARVYRFSRSPPGRSIFLAKKSRSKVKDDGRSKLGRRIFRQYVRARRRARKRPPPSLRPPVNRCTRFACTRVDPGRSVLAIPTVARAYVQRCSRDTSVPGLVYWCIFFFIIVILVNGNSTNH